MLGQVTLQVRLHQGNGCPTEDLGFNLRLLHLGLDAAVAPQQRILDQARFTLDREQHGFNLGVATLV